MPLPEPELTGEGEGCSRAAWRSSLGERGMGAVWKMRLATRMNGMTSRSSSG